jgi:hypothetical protein
MKLSTDGTTFIVQITPEEAQRVIAEIDAMEHIPGLETPFPSALLELADLLEDGAG